MTVGDIINHINFVLATVECLRDIAVVNNSDLVIIDDAGDLLLKYIEELKRKSIK